MGIAERVVSDHYVNVDYFQFSKPAILHAVMRFIGIFTWPLILPLAFISKMSDFLFHTVSELLACLPFFFGIIIRYEFYKLTLTKCGQNVLFGFGTVFFYRDVEIGDNVHIGMFNTFHHCTIGSYVLIADGCRFLSGKYYHKFDRTDVPIALQGGKYRRIRIHNDCWIGTNAIVMNDIGEGSVVGAGTVVTSPVKAYSVAVGNPAKIIKSRK